MQDVNGKYLALEETEKRAVRNALIEERGRFCLFISCLKPVVVRHFVDVGGGGAVKNALIEEKGA